MSNKDVDNALYDAFGQRQVATIYDALNQYHVVMEAMPQFTQTPGVAEGRAPCPATAANAASPAAGAAERGLRGGLHADGVSANPGSKRRVHRRDGQHHRARDDPAVDDRHLQRGRRAFQREPPGRRTGDDGLVQPGRRLSRCRTPRDAIEHASASIHMPINVRGSIAGHGGRRGSRTATSTPLLIMAAIVVIYIVLGVLYESLVHPLTVLSTLPSAGVGAVLALMIFGMEFSLIALIGVFLLIGIVKKNAIMIIDFALEAERSRGHLGARRGARGPAACASGRS